MSISSIRTNFLRACFAAWIAAVFVAFACGCTYAVFLDRGRSLEFLLAVIKGSRDALQALLYVGVASAAVAAIVAAVLIALLARPLIGIVVDNSSVYAAAVFCVVLFLVILLIAFNHFAQVLLDSDFYFAVMTTVASGSVALVVFRVVVSRKS